MTPPKSWRRTILGRRVILAFVLAFITTNLSACIGSAVGLNAGYAASLRAWRYQVGDWHIRCDEFPGSIRIFASYRGGEHGGAGIDAQLSNDVRLPFWSQARSLPRRSSDDPHIVIADAASGWPLLSHRAVGQTMTQPIPEFDWPIIPIPSAYVGNLAFHGLAWLALLSVLPTCRWFGRSSTGQCLHCGYESEEANPHDACPQCAKAPSSVRLEQRTTRRVYALLFAGCCLVFLLAAFIPPRLHERRCVAIDQRTGVWIDEFASARYRLWFESETERWIRRVSKVDYVDQIIARVPDLSDEATVKIGALISVIALLEPSEEHLRVADAVSLHRPEVFPNACGPILGCYPLPTVADRLITGLDRVSSETSSFSCLSLLYAVEDSWENEGAPDRLSELRQAMEPMLSYAPDPQVRICTAHWLYERGQLSDAEVRAILDAIDATGLRPNVQRSFDSLNERIAER